MKTLRLFSLSIALTSAICAMAVPAKRTTFTAIQPDGTEVTLTRAGDEFHKYFLTDDNQIVVGNATDGYFFASIDKATGRIVASDITAANAGSRTAAQSDFISSIDKDEMSEAMTTTRNSSRMASYTNNRNLAPKADIISQSGVGLFPGASYPRTGSPKGLIILVEYSDVKFSADYDAGDYFTRMMTEKGFSDYYGTGSALDWFTDASNGQFTPEFDVYGPVTLTNNQAYYGGNDNQGNDLRPEDMVIDGCRLLDRKINFLDYDTDGDGYVDNVFVFYAGRGEADGGSANTVWPHQWDIRYAGKSLTLDGVSISRYACSNELSGYTPAGIGTFIHEFSHVMGLPDLYHTSASANYTPSDWSILDYGPYNNNGRTPPTYSIFERNAMGWIDPIVLDKTPRVIELSHIETSNSGCIIPTPNKNEFFLLENRQKSGWDKYIPGHGMLIWHIDYNASVWSSNAVNNTKSHQYVDIEEANNNTNGSTVSVRQNWAFPGTNGSYTSFTDTSRPNMKTWGGIALDIPITNIKETNGIITFDVCGGAPDIESPIAYQPSTNVIGNNFFTASWSEVEGAVDYLLYVYNIQEGEAFTDVNTFGSGKSLTHAEGWTSDNSNGVYASAGNYGESSPSLKLNQAGHYVQTPVYDFSIDHISFWAKGQGSFATNSASLYAVNGERLSLLTTFSNWDLSTGSIVDYTLTDSNVHQLRLIFNKELSGANLAIDDFTVDCSTGGKTVMPNYNGVPTSGATSMLVEGLQEGRIYYFSVVAVNAEGKKSAVSNEIEVDLTTAGIDEIIVDNNAPVEYFNLQGIRVDNPGTGIYIRRQGSLVEKVIR